MSYSEWAALKKLLNGKAEIHTCNQKESITDLLDSYRCTIHNFLSKGSCFLLIGITDSLELDKIQVRLHLIESQGLSRIFFSFPYWMLFECVSLLVRLRGSFFKVQLLKHFCIVITQLTF